MCRCLSFAHLIVAWLLIAPQPLDMPWPFSLVVVLPLLPRLQNNTLAHTAYFEIFLNKKLLSLTLKKTVQLHSGAQFS
jgi:hypothetical protein